ncbi:hypothetical protein MetexDRAFT_1188 [Methylorubrum extorquens DSM 13060]|uniref:Uncharacterized protein n=1 Tax=Methylorubrum extorquens DSM 13060 TaxID=882800 RepID=H1KEX6_METEX|nr:hypothetical protein MetexDRAFT_1188 [Methylorubrum extorquens DSM 13060]MCP1546346.1 hypothetical protein [Methylorubrum extorquens]MCP1591013.1 hypothetical protein [Methylorubrum extorquens]
MMSKHSDAARKWACAILAFAAMQTSGTAGSSPVRNDPPLSFSEPVGVPHRHCAGSCISRGSLQWYCRADQTCELNCSTAPPAMECHGGED